MVFPSGLARPGRNPAHFEVREENGSVAKRYIETQGGFAWLRGCLVEFISMIEAKAVEREGRALRLGFAP